MMLLERVQADVSNSDRATRQTVEVMTRHIHRAASDPRVRAHAVDAVKRFGAGNGSQQGVARAVFWWAKHSIRFRHHEDMLRAWLNESDQLQLLISPEALVQMPNPEGDCAIFAMLVGAFLEVWRIPWELVTVKADPDDPRRYSHVFARAVMSDGGRIPLDASHGAYPGWEVPAVHRFGTQVWDGRGIGIADAGPSWKGLGQYRRRGLGQDAETISAASGGASVDLTQPVAPGFNWSPIVAGLLNQWSQIGGRVIAPQTTYQVGPGGQISYSTPGSSAPPAAIASLGGGSSLIMWGGLAVVLILLIGAAKR